MTSPTQFSLFAQRRFAPFFWTQFLGALNDNVFKAALLTAITYDSLHWTSVDAGLLNNLVPGLSFFPSCCFLRWRASLPIARKNPAGCGR